MTRSLLLRPTIADRRRASMHSHRPEREVEMFEDREHIDHGPDVPVDLQWEELAEGTIE